MSRADAPLLDVAAAPIELREATPADDVFLRDLYACVRAPELAAAGWPEAARFSSGAGSPTPADTRLHRRNRAPTPFAEACDVEQDGWDDP